MNMRTKTRKSLLVAVAALTIAGSVTGAALAAGARSKAPKPAAPALEVTTPDTDNIQSGDQTSPDTGTQAAERTSGAKVKSTTSADGTGSEDPSTETGGEDTGGTSDGPGGHADPPGNVNHEFNGEE